LVEVREAVSGYRQPTLAAELAGARVALAAAGIAADVDAPSVALDAAVEGVLAWAVREGATNVIRHSGASRCTVRVAVGLAEASVEVEDDGRGVGGAERPSAAAPGGGGHGVAGLRERAAVLGGSVEAGGRPEGGFRLRVSVPVDGVAPGGSNGGGDVARSPSGSPSASASASPVARP
jgi:two-component system sensor histidine kinase DesK